MPFGVRRWLRTIGVLTASVLVLAACGDSDTSERVAETAATLATTQAPTTAATPTSDLAPGTIVTVIGTQPRVSSEGLGGPAIEARLGIPIDLAFDADGNLYIADATNNVIRMVAQ